MMTTTGVSSCNGCGASSAYLNLKYTSTLPLTDLSLLFNGIVNLTSSCSIHPFVLLTDALDGDCDKDLAASKPLPLGVLDKLLLSSLSFEDLSLKFIAPSCPGSISYISSSDKLAILCSAGSSSANIFVISKSNKRVLNRLISLPASRD